jgi:aldehyde dehydrogenase (NAD+)
LIADNSAMNIKSAHFIQGAWQEGASAATLPVIDPSHGTPFGQIARGNASDIAQAVDSAQGAFEGSWGRLAAAERGRLLLRLSQLVTQNLDELAQLEARDVGKPLTQARGDAKALARYFEFYAGAADKLHGHTIPYQNGYTVMTLREPYGVTGHMIPWNYPMQIFGRSVGASLAAGNACVVKPAEDASLAVLRLAQLGSEAGLPPGALNVVTGLGTEAGQALAEHPGVRHISFTGSGATGTRVAQAAAVNHVPVTLELGGKSPQLVFADADFDAAIPAIINAIIQNAGQTCSAGSRVLVQQPRYAELIERLATKFEQLVAAPAMADRDLGPLISDKQQKRVWEFVSQAQGEGLEVLAQGQVDDAAPETGFYQAPLLLACAKSESRLFQQEIFGPILLITPFEDEEQALSLANATPYGLVAGIWTRDGARQLRLARGISSGQVFVNNYGAGGGVELPFGGTKSSGYGREKGFEALYGFTQLKTIALRHGE